MTMDMYDGQHEALMKKWKEKHNYCINGFAEDGIVSPEVWFKLPAGEERIMFLLKEAYAKEDDNHEKRGKKLVWDEAKWLAHDKCWQECSKDCKTCRITGSTFNPVAEWIYGIKNACHGEMKAYDNWLGVRSRKLRDYRSERDSLLLRVAVVNIKKSSGAKSSNVNDIMSYAEWDKELLKEQIDLIKPTVIVCGGTYEMLRHIYPELKAHAGNGSSMLGNIKVIASCHPNAHIKNEEKYQTVVQSYIRLLGHAELAE